MTDHLTAAVDWHLRQAELSGDDWLRFVEWLEDPAHARAYDAVATADRALDGLRGAVTPPVNLAPPAVYRAPVRKRWAWAGGAMAAGVAALLALPMIHGGADPYAIQTRAGEHQTLVLADATRIELNGATRLVLDRRDPRVARLEAGEAVFHVRHDAAHPFTLRAGGRTMAKGDRVALGHVSPDTVGGWRSGRLSYSDAPLASVAAALERRYGTPVSLGEGLPDRPFSGTVTISGSATRDIPHLAALIGADVRHEGSRWLLSAR